MASLWFASKQYNTVGYLSLHYAEIACYRYQILNNDRRYLAPIQRKMIANIIGGAIGLLIGACIYTMAFLFKPFQRWSRNTLPLRRFSLAWCAIERYTRLSTILEILSGLVFVACLYLGYRFFPNALAGEVTWSSMILLVPIAMAAVFVFNICLELRAYGRSPDVHQDAAGAKAEKEVRKQIQRIERRNPGSYSIHNGLFVFNSGTENEFSCEADHILITPHQMFLIETKYKSGTILATPDAPKWQVDSDRGTSHMRNALKQVKNTARVLGKQFQLPGEFVPLVVFYGQNVQLVNAPSNVITLDSLDTAVAAFNSAAKNRQIDSTAVTNLLQAGVATDRKARARHIERATAASRKAEMEDIVSGSSLQ